MNFTLGDLEWWARMASGMVTRLVDGGEKEEVGGEEEDDILRVTPE